MQKEYSVMFHNSVISTCIHWFQGLVLLCMYNLQLLLSRYDFSVGFMVEFMTCICFLLFGRYLSKAQYPRKIQVGLHAKRVDHL
jgi:hypothetical protein